MEVLTPFRVQVGGGGVVTVTGLTPGQAAYWELVGYDPESQTEGPAWGALRWGRSVADAAGCAVNLYLASTDPAAAGHCDRIKAVRCLS